MDFSINDSNVDPGESASVVSDAPTSLGRAVRHRHVGWQMRRCGLASKEDAAKDAWVNAAQSGGHQRDVCASRSCRSFGSTGYELVVEREIGSSVKRASDHAEPTNV